MSITLQAEWNALDAMHQGTSATEPLSKLYKNAFEVALSPISWVNKYSTLNYVFLSDTNTFFFICDKILRRYNYIEMFGFVFFVKFDVFFPGTVSINGKGERRGEEQERIKDDNFVRCCNESQYCNFSCRAFGCIIHFYYISFFFFLFLIRNFLLQFLFKSFIILIIVRCMSFLKEDSLLNFIALYMSCYFFFVFCCPAFSTYILIDYRTRVLYNITISLEFNITHCRFFFFFLSTI